MNRRILLAAVAATAIAAACGGGDTPPAADTSPATTATSLPTPTATDVSPSPTTPTPPAELEDGRHFGYIEAIDPTVRTIVFDLAYLLTGDEANQAASEHGDEVPVPNDYYIVNDNDRRRTLTLAPHVRILVLERFGPDLVRGEFNGFVEGFDANDFEGQYHGSAGSYWVVVRGGLVVRIQEQYFP